jgi:hypothetical protein
MHSLRGEVRFVISGTNPGVDVGNFDGDAVLVVLVDGLAPLSRHSVLPTEWNGFVIHVLLLLSVCEVKLQAASFLISFGCSDRYSLTSKFILAISARNPPADKR